VQGDIAITVIQQAEATITSAERILAADFWQHYCREKRRAHKQALRTAARRLTLLQEQASGQDERELAPGLAARLATAIAQVERFKALIRRTKGEDDGPAMG
jgi:hypothetical protein